MYYVKGGKRIGGITLNPNDPTFSAAAVVGAALIAAQPVTTYSEPQDQTVVQTYQPGQTVGTVYSWIDQDSTSGIAVLNWMFQDVNGNFYYAPHSVGAFSTQALADQGVQTVGQQTQAALTAAANANKPAWQVAIEGYLPWIGGGVLALGALYVLLKTRHD